MFNYRLTRQRIFKHNYGALLFNILFIKDSIKTHWLQGDLVFFLAQGKVQSQAIFPALFSPTRLLIPPLFVVFSVELFDRMSSHSSQCRSLGWLCHDHSASTWPSAFPCISLPFPALPAISFILWPRASIKLFFPLPASGYMYIWTSSGAKRTMGDGYGLRNTDYWYSGLSCLQI